MTYQSNFRQLMSELSNNMHLINGPYGLKFRHWIVINFMTKNASCKIRSAHQKHFMTFIYTLCLVSFWFWFLLKYFYIWNFICVFSPAILMFVCLYFIWYLIFCFDAPKNRAHVLNWHFNVSWCEVNIQRRHKERQRGRGGEGGQKIETFLCDVYIMAHKSTRTHPIEYCITINWPVSLFCCSCCVCLAYHCERRSWCCFYYWILKRNLTCPGK